MTSAFPRRFSLAAAVMIGSVAAIPAAATATNHARTPGDRVYVIQGVPRVAVDVAVDGNLVRRSVAAKAIVGPLTLRPGKHTVSFTTNGWKVSSSVTISHRSSDVVLHWPADPAQKPVVTVFANDLAPVSGNKGRLTVVHAAVVPPADVRVDKKVLFSNIANGEFVSAEVPGGTYSVDIVPTGQTTNPLLGPVMLPVKSGDLTRVFAIGKPSNGSMNAVVQTLPLASSGSPAPGNVDAGSAGLVATPQASSSSDTDFVLLLTGAALVAGACGFVLVSRRRKAS
jgi:Domain of unknown function (DUF4397)